MNALRLLCLAFTVAYAAQVDPALGDTRSYDLSNFPGCVSQRQDAIEGDIPLTRLRYKSVVKKETDDEHLHAAFLARALANIRGKDSERFDNDIYVTFAVYYRFNKGDRKQFATSVICENEFGSEENICRNRNYWLFSYLDPVTLAKVIVDDIVRSSSLIRRCAWNK